MVVRCWTHTVTMLAELLGIVGLLAPQPPSMIIIFNFTINYIMFPSMLESNFIRPVSLIKLPCGISKNIWFISEGFSVSDSLTKCESLGRSSSLVIYISSSIITSNRLCCRYINPSISMMFSYCWLLLVLKSQYWFVQFGQKHQLL